MNYAFPENLGAFTSELTPTCSTAHLTKPFEQSLPKVFEWSHKESQSGIQKKHKTKIKPSSEHKPANMSSYGVGEKRRENLEHVCLGTCKMI